MAFSSLADELAGAFDEEYEYDQYDHNFGNSEAHDDTDTRAGDTNRANQDRNQDDSQPGGRGMSLADEFGCAHRGDNDTSQDECEDEEAGQERLEGHEHGSSSEDGTHLLPEYAGDDEKQCGEQFSSAHNVSSFSSRNTPLGSPGHTRARTPGAKTTIHLSPHQDLTFGLDARRDQADLEYEIRPTHTFSGDMSFRSPPVYRGYQGYEHEHEHELDHNADAEFDLGSELEQDLKRGRTMEEDDVPELDHSPIPSPLRTHARTIPQVRSPGDNSLTPSRVRTRQSAKSLRMRKSQLQFIADPTGPSFGSGRSDEPHASNDMGMGSGSKMGQDALIVLSETLGTTSRFLASLRALNESGQYDHNVSLNGGDEVRISPTVPISASASSGGGGVIGTVDGSLEDRLQRHLNKMTDSERRRIEMIRELGAIAHEAGVGELDFVFEQSMMTAAASEVTKKLGTLEEGEEDAEDEGDEEYIGGWTGEVVEDHTSSAVALLGDAGREQEQEKVKEVGRDDGREQVRDKDRSAGTLEEDEHVDPLDALMEMEEEAMEGSPTYPSKSTSLLTPTTSVSHAHPYLQSLSHPPSHSKPTSSTQPLLPHLAKTLTLETQSLILTLRHLQDSLQTNASSFPTLTRNLKGMKIFVESWRESERIENEARKKVEGWEERKVRDGLKGDSLAERMRREYEEFEGVLEGYGRRLEDCKRSASVR